ncbi:MAG: kynureninase [Alphaproteobacteria bacterium]
MITREDLADKDAADTLAPFRNEFALPEGVVYLDGNSLGALPKAVAAQLQSVVAKEWGSDLIRSWTKNDWIGLPARLGNKIGDLIGAARGQVVAADSTSVNLFKALSAALQMQPGRRVILSEADNFPTDLYVAQGLARLLDRGHVLRLVSQDELMGALGDDVAVVMVTQVNYRSGFKHDMAAITAKAHDHGVMALWDLSHSAGAFAVDLDGCDADFAVGCGYKFLNGGPGAPAFLYVAKRHQEQIAPALSGWMGHAAPFDFVADYAPAAGIGRQLCGTPSVLAMTVLETAVDLLLRADMAALRDKSSALIDVFIGLVEQECGDFGLQIVTPRDGDRRGSQVALRHDEGYGIMQALIARGVIGDFRAPDILRFGITPLYQRYTEMWDAVAALKEVMETRAWDAPDYKTRAAVT